MLTHLARFGFASILVACTSNAPAPSTTADAGDGGLQPTDAGSADSGATDGGSTDAGIACGADQDCGCYLYCAAPTCTPGCTDDLACPPAQLCHHNGRCASTCPAAPCPTGFSCDAGRCVSPVDGGCG